MRRNVQILQEGKMSQDLCVKMQDGILNIRVGAIIIKDGKFLMVQNHLELSYNKKTKFHERHFPFLLMNHLEKSSHV